MLTSSEAIRLLRVVALAAKGEIEESSTPDGQTLTIRFSSTPLAAVVNQDITEPPKLSGRVLHVEDGDRAADLTHYYLRDLYTVDAAQDAEQAMQLALANNYDIILMDMNLGRGMDGFELTGLLRQTTQYAKKPIIALTGYTSRKDIERCISAGCTAYLSKPFLKEDLLKLLRELSKSNS